MNIIIEGPDAVGKSTLASYLEENNGYELIPEISELKHSVKFDTQKNLWKFFVAGYNVPILSALIKKDNLIKHRLHLSEYVYCHLLKRESLDGFDYESMDNIICDKNILLVLLEIEYGDYIKRSEEKNEKERFWSEEEFNEVKHLFTESFEKSGLRKIKINATLPIVEMVKLIVNETRITNNQIK